MKYSINIVQNLIYIRPATEQDIVFLYTVLTEAMQNITTKVIDEKSDIDEKDRYYRYQKNLKLKQLCVIQYQNQDVGRLNIRYTEFQIYVFGIQILPKFQNLGIGTYIFEQLTKDSKATGRPMYLKVHKINLRAIDFYKRFGFEIIAELETKFLMEYAH
jgi:ribosomal protein S18 acetylase RimI-like enzyme